MRRVVPALWVALAVGVGACGRSGVLEQAEDPFPLPRPFGTTPPASPTPTPDPFVVAWVNVIGGSEDDVAHAVSVSGDGSVGCAGSFRGSAVFGVAPDFAFGGDELVTDTSAGQEDAFIAVYDTQDGQYDWRETPGGVDPDVAYALALRAGGRALAGGRFESPSISFDDGAGELSNSGGGDQFVVALDDDGAFLWSDESSSSTPDEVRAVAWTGDAFSLGFESDSGGDTDDFAHRRDGSNGSVQGAVSAASGSGNEYMTAVAAAPAGDATWVGAGHFDGASSFNGTGYTAGSEDGIAWHCQIGSGCVTWVLHVGGAGNQRLTAVAHVPGGDYVVAGWFDGAATLATRLEGSPVDSAALAGSGEDVLVARVAPDGNIVWAVRAGGAGSDRATAVAVAPDGRIHVAGTYAGAFDPGGTGLDPLPPVAAGSFLLVLDEDGAVASAARVGGEGVEVNALAIDDNGDDFLAGAFSGTVDFRTGSGPVTASGPRDAFLLRGRMP